MAKKASTGGASRGSTYGTIHSATPLKLKIVTILIIATGLSVCFWEEFSETRFAHHTSNLHDKAPGANYLRNADGLWLHTTSRAAAGARGDVFFLHGYGAHCGRLAEAMALAHSKGYNAHCMDHQGFGRSDGDRAYTPDFGQYVRDQKQFIDATRAKGGELVIFGSSLGGLIAADLVETHFAGEKVRLALFAPALGPRLSIKDKVLAHVLPLVSQLLPKFPVSEMDRTVVNNNPKDCADFVADPLTYKGPYLARPSATSLRAMRAVAENAGVLKNVDLLVQAAGKDAVCSLERTQAFVDAVPSGDKKLVVYADAWHALWADPSAKASHDDFAKWLAH